MPTSASKMAPASTSPGSQASTSPGSPSSRGTGPARFNQLWLDGALVDLDSARISPFDHGLTVGDGVFETLKVIGGEPFAISRHLRRLHTSATGLGLAAPNLDRVREAVSSVLEANQAVDARLRITLTGGLGPLGSNRDETEPTLLVAVSELHLYSGATKVVTVPWTRNERGAMTGIKSTSYAENVLALAYAHERHASEAIFANTVGNLCEGTGSNIFVGIDGRLVTPPLSAGPLGGITRELILEVVDVVEEDLPLEALFEADEAFLSSSIRDVQAISAVDDHVFDLAPGPLTKAAADALARLEAQTSDP